MTDHAYPFPSSDPPQPPYPVPPSAPVPSGTPAPSFAPFQPSAPAPSFAPFQPGAPVPPSAPVPSGAPAPSFAPFQSGAPAPTGAPFSSGVPFPTGDPSPSGDLVPTPIIAPFPSALQPPATPPASFVAPFPPDAPFPRDAPIEFTGRLRDSLMLWCSGRFPYDYLSYTPPDYTPVVSNEEDLYGDFFIDVTLDPCSKTLQIILYRSGGHTFTLIIKHRPPDSSDASQHEATYELPVSEESVFNWARKLADLNTYIRLYGTVRGYEGPSSLPEPYSEGFRSDFDKVLFFARTVLSFCEWDFLMFDFIQDLYRSWNNEYYPAKPLDNKSHVDLYLNWLVYTNTGTGRIGWAHVEYDFSFEPALTMRKPEPLIDIYHLEKWKKLRYGFCPDLANQYEPSIGDNWARYLSEAGMRCGLVRLCKCNLPILPGRPFSREMEQGSSTDSAV